MGFTFDDIAAPASPLQSAWIRQISARIREMEAKRAEIPPEDGPRMQLIGDRIQRLMKARDRLAAEASFGKSKKKK